jgi:hypothetical protein
MLVEGFVFEVGKADCPTTGGETSDALMVYLPASGGDVMMPYLGAPFFAEGSPEGLLDALRLIAEINPRVLVHRGGHASPAAALRYRHATEDRDRALADAMAGLDAGARFVKITTVASDR